MTDIVERLRHYRVNELLLPLLNDAADEIERLRGVVETREIALRQLTKRLRDFENAEVD